MYHTTSIACVLKELLSLCIHSNSLSSHCIHLEDFNENWLKNMRIWCFILRTDIYQLQTVHNMSIFLLQSISINLHIICLTTETMTSLVILETRVCGFNQFLNDVLTWTVYNYLTNFQVILLYGIISFRPITYGPYVYPPLANVIGWFVAGSSITCIPLFAVIGFIRADGSPIEVN